MIQDCASWRIKVRRAVPVLIAAMLSFAYFCAPPVLAQSAMRSPSINIQSRLPTITPTVVAPRIDPNIAGRVDIGSGRNIPSLRSACTAAERDSGECSGQAANSSGSGGNGRGSGKNRNTGSRGNTVQTALDQPTIANELVAEIDGSLSDVQADQLARRHGLARLQSQNFPLIGSTIGLFRVTDRRAVATVSREFAAEAGVRSVQPNFRYVLQQQKAELTEGDPAQYAVAKLRLPQAHTLAHGANVIVAVIDSGIDINHQELANSIAASFDALGSKEGPHVHGTGIAGAIAAHARLIGSAPAARILAIRAFGVVSNGAQSSSYVILKGLDYAAAHGAEIVNMSFAGPKDALIERGIAAMAARGILMVAAAGNAGAKSPPLYPAANTNVIAVSATDAQDRLFSASNRGGYIAVAAPGVDIFLPAPDNKYQMTSGTSFSAAYVSGLAALMLERNPALKPDEVRAILMKTARDLGAAGRDDLFGAGEADAYAAVLAVVAAPAVPVAAGSEPQGSPATRGLEQPAAATLASGKPADVDPKPAAQ
jgi:subtilisin family serine protease